MGTTLSFPPSCFPQAPVRADELRYIVDTLRRGYCCAVVGPSNTGKSLLLQSLLSEEVRQMCAQKSARPPIMVFLDCLGVEPTEQAFYESLLRRVMEELEVASEAPSALDAIRAQHQRVAQSPNVESRAAFASALRSLHRKSDTCLIIILDEFDDLYQSISHWASRRLRVLHDELGNRLLLVVSTSRHLDRLRPDPETYEFRELFVQHTRMLRPLDSEDATSLVTYLTDVMGMDLSPNRARLAIEASGGHPGLLARLCEYLSSLSADPDVTGQALFAQLSEIGPIRLECQRLWAELDLDEQSALLVLVRGDQLSKGRKQAEGVEDKGLVVTNEAGALLVFSPVFRAFVSKELLKQQETRRRGPWYDANTRQTWLDDREITRKLTSDQFAFLVLLCENPGVVMSKDDIGVAVWPEQAENSFSDDQIYQLVKRTREKIEPDPKKPIYIVSVTGQGYRLERPTG